MRLNLGCADWYRDGWVNVDFGSPHRVDERVDLTGPLPWEPGTVTDVYAGHLFEHLTLEACSSLAERLLPCMDPKGGLLAVVGPDIPLAEQMVAEGTFDSTHHSLDLLRHGAGRWAGDVHLWETSGQAVADVLRAAGWSVATDVGIANLGDWWPVADPAPQWQHAVIAWSGLQ